MKITELRKQMMSLKKDQPERAKVLASILSNALLIAKNDKNREANDSDIVEAARKEVKEANQSKDQGAPYNELTFEICAVLLPTILTEAETQEAVQEVITVTGSTTKKDMGKVMGALGKKYANTIDMKMAQAIVMKSLA